MTGGGYNSVGAFQPHGSIYTRFMIRNGNSKVEKVDFGKKYKKIAKIFSDCPKFLEYQKNRKLRRKLNLEKICEIYNESCPKK